MPFDGTNYERQDVVLDLLKRARELIRERGWHQGETFAPDGRVCIYGALRAAGLSGNWEDTGLPWPAVWQDEPGRTIDDVEAWFEREIEKRVAA